MQIIWNQKKEMKVNKRKVNLKIKKRLNKCLFLESKIWACLQKKNLANQRKKKKMGKNQNKTKVKFNIKKKHLKSCNRLKIKCFNNRNNKKKKLKIS